MLRGFLAPTGAMVNSQGLPAPGPRSHSGPRGWKPLAIFPCPVGAEKKQGNIKKRLAPTGAMVNSQGLPAPGPRSRSGPRGWKPLAIFPCPVGAEKKQGNIKKRSPRQGRRSIARGFQPLVHVRIQGPGAGSPWLFSRAPLGQSTNSATSKPASDGRKRWPDQSRWLRRCGKRGCHRIYESSVAATTIVRWRPATHHSATAEPDRHQPSGKGNRPWDRCTRESRRDGC